MDNCCNSSLREGICPRQVDKRIRAAIQALGKDAGRRYGKGQRNEMTHGGELGAGTDLTREMLGSLCSYTTLLDNLHERISFQNINSEGPVKVTDRQSGNE